MVVKYAHSTGPSLLKRKKIFANSKLASFEKYPDDWIMDLESLRNDIDKICLSTRVTDQNFTIHIPNNFIEEYDVVLDGMNSRLMLGDSDLNELEM